MWDGNQFENESQRCPKWILLNVGNNFCNISAMTAADIEGRDEMCSSTSFHPSCDFSLTTFNNFSSVSYSRVYLLSVYCDFISTFLPIFSINNQDNYNNTFQESQFPHYSQVANWQIDIILWLLCSHGNVPPRAETPSLPLPTNNLSAQAVQCKAVTLLPKEAKLWLRGKATSTTPASKNQYSSPLAPNPPP